MKDYDSIPDIPEIEEKIIDAVNDRKLAVFIGAGVSRLCGCVGWQSLAKELITFCHNSKIINYRAFTHLIEQSNNRKKITIAKHLLCESGKKEDFYEIMESSLLYKKKEKSLDIYRDLLTFKSVLLTTNSDDLIHRVLPRKENIFVSPESFLKDNLSVGNLFHLHGFIEDRDSLIYTLRDYIELYGNEKVKNFLKDVFKKYTVLFVGYGLEELELLEYVLSQNASDIDEIKHYVLRGYLRGEESLLQHDSIFYGNLGVGILPFAKDDNGHEQLSNVVKDWAKYINTASSAYNSGQKQIDDAVIRFDVVAAKNVMQLISIDEDLKKYFYRKMTSVNNPTEWYYVLDTEKLFNPALNPHPVIDKDGRTSVEFWSQLVLIENIAKNNLESPNKKCTKILVNFLKVFIKFQDKSAVMNYHTDSIVCLSISALPVEKITLVHLKHMKSIARTNWRNTLLATHLREYLIPKLVKCKRPAIIKSVMEIVFSYKSVDGDFKGLIEGYWLQKIVDESLEGLIEHSSETVYKTLIKIVERITKEKKSSFSNVWIPTIDDSGQSSFRDRYEISLIRATRNSLQSYCRQFKPVEEVARLLKKRHQILRRLAVNAIDSTYPSIKNVFWDCVDNKFLSLPSSKYEIYRLLDRNSSKFTKVEQNKIVTAILSINKYEEEKYNFYLKKEWVSSLHFKIPDKFNASIIEIDSFVPGDVDNPGFKRHTPTAKFVKNESPLSLEEVISLTPSQLVKYAEGYNDDSWDGPNKEGLANMLEEFSKKYPEQVLSDFKGYQLLKPLYLSHLIRGLKEGVGDSKPTPLRNTLVAFEEILAEEKFWEEVNKEDYTQEMATVMSISDLLGEICNEKIKELTSDELSYASNIILNIFENLSFNKPNNIDDRFADFVLNRPLGRLLESFIAFNLGMKRELDDNQFWNKKHRNYFEIKLLENDACFETTFSFGKYFNQFRYLDPIWTEDVLSRFYSTVGKDTTQFKGFVSGYLFYSQTLYKDSYDILIKHSFYEDSLKLALSEYDGAARISQHIALSFGLGWDKGDVLVEKLVNDGHSIHLKSLVNFLSSYSKANKYSEEKVIFLWKTLHQRISELLEEGNDFSELMYELTDFLEIFDSYPKELHHLIIHESGYAKKDYGYYSMLEQLANFSEGTPVEVGEIILKMASSKVFLTYPEDKMKNVLEDIYKTGNKELGNQITNEYMRTGYDFVRDIHEKYNR